jgi:transposase-like protein
MVPGREKASMMAPAVEQAPPAPPPSQGPAERSGAGPEEGGGRRRRPGRRTAVERREAVLALLAGKASVDQIAREYGVHPETVDGWKKDAIAAIEEALRRGDARNPRERELALENRKLKAALTDISVERALLGRALEEWKNQSRPSRPRRSRA